MRQVGGLRALSATIVSVFFAACSGSGHVSPPTASNSGSAGSTTGSSPGATVGSSLYTVIYLPLQAQCQSATVGGLASNGIAAVNEFCSQDRLAVYVYDHGKISTLPSRFAFASAINSNKIAIVRSEGNSQSYVYNVTANTIATLAYEGYASAINDAGLSVGIYNGCPSAEAGCLIAGEFNLDGSLTSLVVPASFNVDINKKGDVSSQGGGAFFTTSSGNTTDIGSLLGFHAPQSATAWGINDQDHVVVSDGSTTVLWLGAKNTINVPSLPGDAYTDFQFVSDTDAVVGESCNASGLTCRPFVSQNGSTEPLTQLVPGLTPSAMTIYDGPSLMENAKGEILINAVRNGQNVVALLIPNGCVDP